MMQVNRVILIFVIMLCPRVVNSQESKIISLNNWGLELKIDKEWSVDLKEMNTVELQVGLFNFNFYLGESDSLTNVNDAFDIYYGYLASENYRRKLHLEQQSGIWGAFEKEGKNFIVAYLSNNKCSYRIVGCVERGSPEEYIELLSGRINFIEKTVQELNIDCINEFKSTIKSVLSSEKKMNKMNEEALKLIRKRDYPDFIVQSYLEKQHKWTKVFKNIQISCNPKWCFRRIEMVCVERFDNQDEIFIGSIVMHNLDESDALVLNFEAHRTFGEKIILFDIHNSLLNEVSTVP